MRSSIRTGLRNLRLLAQSGLEHLVDDPALLAVQVSRRTPLAVRTRAGAVLQIVGRVIPGTSVEALGFAMSGDPVQAERALREHPDSPSRLHAALAVMLGHAELVPPSAPVLSRARAVWARGHLSEAVRLLHDAGQERSRHARRLASELRLLEPGHRLRVETVPVLDPRWTRCEEVPGEAPTGSHSLGAASLEAAERPHRVLHILTNSLPHTQSGYSLRSHRILRAQAQHGIESVVLTRTGYPVMIGVPFAEDEDVVEGVRYWRSLPASLGGTPEERLEQQVRRALQIVAEFRPTIIHATTPYQNALVAQAVSEATGIPWVYEVRGLAEQTWIAAQPTAQERKAAAGTEKVRLIAARESELAQRAHALVTLSGTMADELAGRGVDPDRIALVPNGVEAGLFEHRVTVEQARRDLCPELTGAFVVGAASALVEYEGFSVLLDAVARIVEDATAPAGLREHLHVVLVGDGGQAPELRLQAEARGIGSRLHLPGRVSREQSRRWVEAMDVVTVPRLDREVTRSVTPQKPIEAMALQRPVVASDLPAIRETVRDWSGEPGAVLVPPGDAEALVRVIQDLYEHPEQRERLAREGELIARGRTWESLVRRYDTVYDRCLADSEEVPARGE